MFRELCDEFILVGHVKDTVTEKDGVEVSAKELDLVGKLSKICLLYTSRCVSETDIRVAERSKIEAYTNHNKESLALKITLLTH